MIIDISSEISPAMIVYKNKKGKKPTIKSTRTIKQGATESRISLDSHTGTHVDAPKHMIANGKGMEIFGLEPFVGKCRVIDFTNVEERITLDNVRKIKPKKGERILFKTKNSSDTKFNKNFIYLESRAAKFLSERGIVLVGIDALGLERGDKLHLAHKYLLKKRIPIVEGLNLKKVISGKYFLCVLPLKIKNIDGSPARAVLIK